MLKSRLQQSIAIGILLLTINPLRAQEFETVITDSPDFEVNGFGIISQKKIPFSVSQYSAETMQKNQVKRLSDLTKLDSSVSDSYNASGYWDFLSVRGITLNNRSNYLREGLPINAETSIPLENKSSIQILKGMSAVQAGLGAPSGVVNYLVKRPTRNQNEFTLQMNDSGGSLAAVDSQTTDFRINLVAERLSPHLDDARGERHVAAFAYDFNLSDRSKLQTEIEWSYKKQRTQGGYSLFGNSIPNVTQFRSKNVNNQDWVKPAIFQGTTATAKYSYQTEDALKLTAMAGAQLLKTDDRLGYAYGCTAENNFDRYCSNGTFDLYDYRSEDEHRNTYAVKLDLQKTLAIHSLGFGILVHSMNERYQQQAYNYVGVGNTNGSVQLSESPDATGQNTNRDLLQKDVYLTDVIKINQWSLWLALHAVDIDRKSFRTNDSQKTNYKQSFLNPAIALSYQRDQAMYYASYSEGSETYVTPNKPAYASPGQFVPDVVSKQREFGMKLAGPVSFEFAAFNITRPEITDQSPRYQIDGYSEHTGFEVSASVRKPSFDWNISYTEVDATRRASNLNAVVNGKGPVNVPAQIARSQFEFNFGKASQLKLNASVSHESKRMILADNTQVLPGWTSFDVGASADYNVQLYPVSWRLNVTNVFDLQYWKEAPTYYQHVYLYAAPERSFTLTGTIIF